MPSKSQKFGKESEALATAYLKLSGYRILERNFRNRIGEIDIVAKEGSVLVFIEVKARKTDQPSMSGIMTSSVMATGFNSCG